MGRFPAGEPRSPGTSNRILRPVSRRLLEHVRARLLVGMLACYLTWHLRRAWAPLTCTGQNPPAPDHPIAAARRAPA